MSPQQQMIESKARELVDLLHTVVPRSTIHYAVEQALVKLQVLAAQAGRITTVDVKAARAATVEG